MQLSTKTLAALMRAVRRTSEMSSRARDKQLQRLDRILKRHDRKADLRAGILGIDAADFRAEQRHASLEQIVRRHGFRNYESFLKALQAKLKHELHQRGWSRRRVEETDVPVAGGKRSAA